MRVMAAVRCDGDLPAVEICNNWAGEGVQGVQLLRHSSQRGKR